MESYEALANLILNNGVALAVVAYFLYKDWKLNVQIISILGQTSVLLSQVGKLLGMDREDGA